MYKQTINRAADHLHKVKLMKLKTCFKGFKCFSESKHIETILQFLRIHWEHVTQEPIQAMHHCTV